MASRIGITGQEVAQHLLDTEPRIILGGSTGTRPNAMASSVGVMPYMMMPGDDKIAAERLHAVLSAPPKFEAPPQPSGPPATVAGVWDVEVEFFRGSTQHSLIIEQSGTSLVGFASRRIDQRRPARLGGRAIGFISDRGSATKGRTCRMIFRGMRRVT